VGELLLGTLGIKAIHFWHLEAWKGETFVRTGTVVRRPCDALLFAARSRGRSILRGLKP
jgi:hypothetical protein